MKLTRCRNVLPWGHQVSGGASRKQGSSALPDTLEHSPAPGPASASLGPGAVPLNSVHLSGVVIEAAEENIGLDGEKVWVFALRFRGPEANEPARRWRVQGREDIEAADGIVNEDGGELVPGVEVLVAGHLTGGRGIRATQLIVILPPHLRSN